MHARAGLGLGRSQKGELSDVVGRVGVPKGRGKRKKVKKGRRANVGASLVGQNGGQDYRRCSGRQLWTAVAQDGEIRTRSKASERFRDGS